MTELELHTPGIWEQVQALHKRGIPAVNIMLALQFWAKDGPQRSKEHMDYAEKAVLRGKKTQTERRSVEHQEWMKHTEAKELRAALRGDIGLSFAFIWAFTPEGHEYWAREDARKELSPEVRIRLQEMLLALGLYGSKEEPKPAPKYEKWMQSTTSEQLRELLDGRRSLGSAFVWCYTPEGGQYWAKESTNPELSQGALARVKEMLREIRRFEPPKQTMFQRAHSAVDNGLV